MSRYDPQSPITTYYDPEIPKKIHIMTHCDLKHGKLFYNDRK